MGDFGLVIMGKTYSDQQKWDEKHEGRGKRKKPKFPRVPPILKRSEPFEDRRFKVKYDWELEEEFDEDADEGLYDEV